MIPIKLSSRPSHAERLGLIGLALFGLVAANMPIYLDNISYFADTVSVVAPLLGIISAIWIVPRMFARGVLSAVASAIGALLFYVVALLISVALSMSQL